MPAKIYDREEVIKLSNENCRCGRVKNKPHCPNCGWSKLYAKAHRTVQILPSEDILHKCVNYRCEHCGERFNDIDWYFNCHAPIKIDWNATRAEYRRREKEKFINEWTIRVRQGETFKFNDYTQCRAQTGMSLDYIIMSVNAETAAEKQTPEISNIETLTRSLEKTRKQIATNEENLQADPNDKDIILALDFLRKKLKNIEDEINSLKEPNNVKHE